MTSAATMVETLCDPISRAGAMHTSDGETKTARTLFSPNLQPREEEFIKLVPRKKTGICPVAKLLVGLTNETATSR